jgi:predicted PurR-regulated permease PerM
MTDAPDSELPRLHGAQGTQISPGITPTNTGSFTNTGPFPGAVSRDSELPKVLPTRLAPDSTRSQRIALSVLLVLTFVVAAWIASGLWVGIALGTVMAFTAQPVFRKLSRRFEGHRPLIAGVVTAGTGLVAMGFGALFLYIAVDELVSIGGMFERKLAVGSLAAIIGEPAARLIERLGMSRLAALNRIHHGLEEAAGFAASWAATLLQTGTGAVLGLVMALLTMYYVLLEWRPIIVKLERVLPLNPRHTRALILEFRQVGRGVLVGTVATAIVQGTLGGIAYVVLGVPQALTWALATGFGSFLPVVGTGIVWGPIGGWLILTGRPLAGVAVFIWGTLVVMMATDYVIRPRLVGRRVGHPLLVMFALLGGIEVFGLAGLIVAPILMSLFLAVLRIYERELRRDAPPVHEELGPTER